MKRPLPLIPKEKVASVMDAVRSGNRMLNTGIQAGTAAGHIAGGAAMAADAALSPLHNAIAKPILNGLAGVGNAATASPVGQNIIRGGLLAAPILTSALSEGTQRQENDLMHQRRDPTRTVTAADLSSFLEKVASIPPVPPGGAPQHGAGAGDFHPSKPQGGLGGEFMKGVGNSVGKSLTDTVMGVVLNGATALSDFLVNDGKRKRLLESLTRNDPMLVDAIKHDAKQAQKIVEAYQTLVHFAPGLSLDVNAVRSFLHEAVVSGGSINYATIKNLVDTQKSIATVAGGR